MPHKDPEKRREYQARWWRERAQGKSKKYPEKTCEMCGATFFGRKTQRTCGRSCGARLAVKEGRQNSFPKASGKYRTSHGYIHLYLPGHPMAIGRGKKWVPEHRYVMSQILGRPLDRSEHVHHRNAVKDDNRPENLEIVTHARHRGEIICPHCGCGILVH